MSNVYHVSAGTPELLVGNPEYNAGRILDLFQLAFQERAALFVLPELALTGATCGDLFQQPLLLEAARRGLERLLMGTSRHRNVLVAGMPLAIGSRLFDAALVLQKGVIQAAVVKGRPGGSASCPEGRRFAGGPVPAGLRVELLGQSVPVVERALFRVPGEGGGGFVFGVEIGSDREDLFPAGAALAAAGAQVVCNPSAEPAVAGTIEERRREVAYLSGRYHCVYVHSGAGVQESTGEGVCSGLRALAVDGELRSPEASGLERKAGLSVCGFEPAALDYGRRRSGMTATWAAGLPEFVLESVPEAADLSRLGLRKLPFVPDNAAEEARHCREVFRIQGLGLSRRLEASHSQRLVLGLSGGLDSTLAMLVCAESCDLLGWPRERVCAVTMPGAATSSRTLGNARRLAELLGAELRTIGIGEAVARHFADIGHDPEKRDVVYENSQARERTQILMDLANALGGIVVGTGDLSEIALGWSTYNGDHMSMYAVNSSVPKTLMRRMVLRHAEDAGGELADVLRDIVETPVSPELLPGGQRTEKLLGSYLLHDFFLYHFLRHGRKPDTLLRFAEYVFRDDFPQEEIEHAVRLFVRRFFGQQFKRNCVPDGVKATGISLSPRSDWRMPSDADDMVWLKDLT